MSASHESTEHAGPSGFKTYALPLGLGLLLATLLGALAKHDGGAAALAGIPVAYMLFVVTLLGVAVFHHYALQVALAGAGTLIAFSLWQSPEFSLAQHVQHEWVVLANLFGLLVGFGLLANHFEHTGIPERLPRVLPGGWVGCFVLLAIVWVISGFLDNIAAAMIGGGVAATVFRGRVHVGYLAGIVAASNAGGAGSVIGDTTTTMMWIAGVSPLDVLHAYVGSIVALVISGIVAAILQDSHQKLMASSEAPPALDKGRVLVVGLILGAVVLANLLQNTQFKGIDEHAPVLAIALWIALLGLSKFRAPAWKVVPSIARGSLFLLSLVLCASLLPLEQLPAPSPYSTLAIGFLSSAFDNIPLTALALRQGGYDWGMLAFAVGFGGSILWFGSSAGVALSSRFPAARSTGNWLRYGWHVPVAYVAGFFVMYWILGWHPHATKAAPQPEQPHLPGSIEPAHGVHAAGGAMLLPGNRTAEELHAELEVLEVGG
jgi:Na+/H+ antiporter NhaD/arsenite permease-like protein